MHIKHTYIRTYTHIYGRHSWEGGGVSPVTFHPPVAAPRYKQVSGELTHIHLQSDGYEIMNNWTAYQLYITKCL